MKDNIRSIAMLLLSIVSMQYVNAQSTGKPDLKGWHLKDKATDGVYGISLQQAYDYIRDHKYKVHPVIVAVIDNGMDTSHEDLKNVLWKNSREVAGNGVDDDRNGYVDDVFGWNFLGNKEGGNITTESTERERAYQKYSTKWQHFDSTHISSLSAADQKEYTIWEKVALANRKPVYVKSDSTVNLAQEMYNSVDRVNKRRKEIVGDNWEDINDRNYGNANVAAGKPSHGTHVAGIIAAERNNGLGIDGVADKARIMPIRAVPDGDERDKDIALAIRYAVDNGARVINMSFGKDFSPGKNWVDEAVKYAEAHDVLLIHAAGNDMKNLDVAENYPSPVSEDTTYKAANWITVGASDVPFGTASFSNYGKKSVDVFAPGTRIYATVPKKSNYMFMDGTSMAAPVVAGIAALIREYFPRLSARQVKYIIEHSVLKPQETVNIPGAKRKNGVVPAKVKLSEICITGGIVNACDAVRLAAATKGELKKRAMKKILKVQER
ncbi:S8 family peptidase [Chitinophaga eiseniae]|uniref:S8 family serine peptidase n=1 Tax=Chitinophaga eiseniae TaxID=634771 RepID=A0A847SH97_9BACT|nr:S8 family peptidase [Chitinophaga eiseniae]NLR78405.1 S8 family serine peptidase [Chitinophaga eiseniae]